MSILSFRTATLVLSTVTASQQCCDAPLTLESAPAVQHCVRPTWTCATCGSSCIGCQGNSCTLLAPLSAIPAGTFTRAAVAAADHGHVRVSPGSWDRSGVR